MMPQKIIIEGRIPSKKNSRNIFNRNGKVYNIPSPEYKSWHDINLLKLKGMQSFVGQVEAQFEFYMPDNIRADLSNKVESVLDLLVDCKIIEDDCWQVVHQYCVSCKEIDRKNPRVEIWIKSI